MPKAIKVRGNMKFEIWYWHCESIPTREVEDNTSAAQVD